MPPDPSSTQSLTAALHLAFVGGLLDAFIYLNHGHVFANAMTGNGVLFAVALLDHDRGQAVRHVVPAIAFLLGVAASKVLGSAFGRHATVVGLSLELLALSFASWLPASFPTMAFTSIISFVSAYQVSSFRAVDSFAYNSTFITGNLRTAADGFAETLSPSTRARGLRKFRDLTLVVLLFLLGATVGAAVAPRLGNHTLWLALPPLGVVLVMALLEHGADPD